MSLTDIYFFLIQGYLDEIIIRNRVMKIQVVFKIFQILELKIKIKVKLNFFLNPNEIKVNVSN